MDETQFKEFIATEAGKALLNGFVEEAKKPLIAKRDELLEEVKTTKAKVQQYSELGDLESVKTKLQLANDAQDAINKAKLEEAKKTGDYSALEAHLKKELAEKEDKINTFKTKAVNAKLDSDLTSAITEAKGTPELLKPVLKNRVKAELNDDGEIVSTVLDANGQPMFVDGKPAQIKDLISEFKANDIYGRAFEGTGASGSGTRASNVRTSGVQLDPSKSDYSVSKAMEYYKANPQALKDFK